MPLLPSLFQSQSAFRLIQPQSLTSQKDLPSSCPSDHEEPSALLAEANKTLNARPTQSKKLTLAEKLEIIHCHETKVFSQTRLAKRYGKSRSAISKLLQPNNVRKLKELAGAGVTTKIKRCSSAHHPELERKAHEFFKTVGRSDTVGKLMLRMFAEKTAFSLGISGFEANSGWCFRFLKRHGFVSSTEVSDESRSEPLIQQATESHATTPDMGGKFSAFKAVGHAARPKLIVLSTGKSELPVLPGLSAILPLVLNVQPTTS